MTALHATDAEHLILFQQDHNFRKCISSADQIYYWNRIQDADKCEGCDHIQIAGDRFCWYCGADRDDVLGRILAVDLDTVVPFPKRSRPSKEEAKIAREWIRDFIGTQSGISVRIARGSSHIKVDVPNDHEWTAPTSKECASRADVPVRDLKKCPYCERRHAACKHLERILSKLIPGTAYHKHSPYDDYAQFTWMIY